MNKSLKFLAIGLALAVLLVSQVGVDRSAEAAPVSLDDGKVSFTNADGEEQDYFKPGDTVDFYINDDDLARPTVNQRTTVIWQLNTASATVSQGQTLNLADGEIDGALAGVFSTSTPHETFAPNGMLSGTTPLVRASVTVTVADDYAGNNGDRLVTSADSDTGTIKIFGDVDGQDASGGNSTTTITVVFEFDLPDVFETDVGEGAGAPSTHNRAKVTSASDSVGEWIKIDEVADEGDTTPHPTSNIYHGSVVLSGDSSATQSGDGKIYVRDGETITVAFYDADDEEVGSDTATIDDQDPLISGLSPSDGTVTDDSSPVVGFTVIDDGSGFDTGNPKSHVTLTVNDCEIPDTPITATRLSRTEMELLFRNPRGSWGQGASNGLNCEDGSVFRADTESDPQKNNHGTEFTIRVEVVDGAGNTSDDSVEITIDTKAPSMVDRDLSTGTGWADGKETADRASVKVVFNESLDADTVDASDFSVENPDVSIEDVIVGGANVEDGTAAEQQLNQLVFLVLSADLPSDARPRVELDGSITDVAGNELESDAVPRINDGIEPGVTVDAFPAQLLAKDGESAISFSADENLSGNVGDLSPDCTCLGITGGGDDGVKKGDVALPTPSTGTNTFKQSAYSSTGIYGIMVQASDSSGNETRVGATKVTDEEVTVTVATGSGTTTREATFSLAKWPLADAGFTGSLDNAVAVKGDHDSSEVTEVDWEAGTVTLELTYSSDPDDIDVGDKLLATYSYVKAEQTIEVDTEAPTVTFEPTGDTQNATPFIRVHFNDNEYAGDTHTTVTVTEATLSDADGNEWVLVGDGVNLLSSSDSKSYSYLPGSGLALGEYTIAAVGRDEAGNSTGEKSGTFKVVARPPVSIPLNLGWNLISLPAAAADSAIDSVINVDAVSQVLTFDPTVEGGWLAAVRVNGAFEGGLTDIDPSKAYLVYTTSVDPLEVDIPGFAQGAQDFPPIIQLSTGWNMIPAASLDPAFETPLDTYLKGITWTRGYFYADDGGIEGITQGNNDEMVTTGRGFLIYVEEDGVLVP